MYTRSRLWRLDGTWERVHARLREDVRMAAGHPPQPLTGRVDSQAVRTTHRGGDRGYDGGEKVLGRERFAVAGSLGPVWALWACPADHQDRDGGRWLPSQVRRGLPRLAEVIADSGFSRKFVDWVRAACGWRVVTTATAGGGFEVHPRRRVVERTFAWFAKYRRLGKDHEYLTESSEDMIYAAMIHRMVRQLHPAT